MGLPWELFCADDLYLIAEAEKVLIDAIEFRKMPGSQGV